MIELARISLWPDVEVAHFSHGDRKEDRCLLLWRVLLSLNKRFAGGSGTFALSWVVENLSELLCVSEETIQRTCVQGDGKWWRLTQKGRLMLTGRKRMAEWYGVSESQDRVRMRVRFVTGGILNFRKVLYALYIQHATNGGLVNGEQFITRAELAERLGVSVSTLRRMEKEDGWVEVAPSVEVVDVVRGSGIVFPREQEREPGTRLWRGEGKDGVLVVKQQANAYRSKLAGYGGRPHKVGESAKLAGGQLVPQYHAKRARGAVIYTEPLFVRTESRHSVLCGYAL